ncbi:hypothetical protein [Sphingobium lactosutens]|uniref:hypothetical protein n=1 Tax=Sphingobium lactosutens TaxID=522773 RepID=UPI0015BFCF7E|nr:hypothetical protein [Sphingobium lactosutens]
MTRALFLFLITSGHSHGAPFHGYKKLGDGHWNALIAWALAVGALDLRSDD